MKLANCVVLVLERTDELDSFLSRFAQYGTHAPIATSLSALLSLCADPAPDMVVFPVDLGYQSLLVARLRNDHPEIGIIALCRQADSSQRVQLLLTGADACLPAQAAVAEVLASCHAIRRRLNSKARAGTSVGSPAQAVQAASKEPAQALWSLEEKGWSLVSPQGKELELTHSERQLMDAFLRAPDARISREDLMRDKGLSMTDSRAIDSLISRLRRKASQHGLVLPIKSVHGWGYTFAGLLSQAAPTLAQVVAGEPVASGATEAPVSDQSLRHWVAQLAKQPDILRASLGFTYQARVAISSGQMHGVDAQVSWALPDGQRYPSSQVLALLSDDGLLMRAHEWMLSTLLSDMRCWWQEYGLRANSVSLMLSPAYIVNAHKQLAGMLGQFGIDPACLELDINLSQGCRIDEPLSAALRHLQLNGFKVYVSFDELVSEQLSALSHLAINGVKLEAPLLHAAYADPAQRAHLELALQRMHELKLSTVLKGVDTLEHRELALSLELSHYQGLLTSEHMSRDAFLLTLACTEPN